MWLLLNNVITAHARPFSQTINRLRVKTLFRGIGTLVNLFPGSASCFRQITSMSISIDVARSFSRTGGTLFIIKSPIGLSIRDFSLYPAEEEFIVSGFDSFVVTGVVNTDSNHRIFLSYDIETHTETEDIIPYYSIL